MREHCKGWWCSVPKLTRSNVDLPWKPPPTMRVTPALMAIPDTLPRFGRVNVTLMDVGDLNFTAAAKSMGCNHWKARKQTQDYHETGEHIHTHTHTHLAKSKSKMKPRHKPTPLRPNIHTLSSSPLRRGRTEPSPTKPTRPAATTAVRRASWSSICRYKHGQQQTKKKHDHGKNALLPCLLQQRRTHFTCASRAAASSELNTRLWRTSWGSVVARISAAHRPHTDLPRAGSATVNLEKQGTYSARTFVGTSKCKHLQLAA